MALVVLAAFHREFAKPRGRLFCLFVSFAMCASTSFWPTRALLFLPHSQGIEPSVFSKLLMTIVRMILEWRTEHLPPQIINSTSFTPRFALIGCVDLTHRLLLEVIVPRIEVDQAAIDCQSFHQVLRCCLPDPVLQKLKECESGVCLQGCSQKLCSFMPSRLPETPLQTLKCRPFIAPCRRLQTSWLGFQHRCLSAVRFVRDFIIGEEKLDWLSKKKSLETRRNRSQTDQSNQCLCVSCSLCGRMNLKWDPDSVKSKKDHCRADAGKPSKKSSWMMIGHCVEWASFSFSFFFDIPLFLLPSVLRASLQKKKKKENKRKKKKRVGCCFDCE